MKFDCRHQTTKSSVTDPADQPVITGETAETDDFGNNSGIIDVTFESTQGNDGAWLYLSRGDDPYGLFYQTPLPANSPYIDGDGGAIPALSRTSTDEYNWDATFYLPASSQNVSIQIGLLPSDGIPLSTPVNNVAVGLPSVTASTLNGPVLTSAKLVGDGDAEIQWTDMSDNETGFDINVLAANGNWVTVGTAGQDVTQFDLTGAEIAAAFAGSGNSPAQATGAPPSAGAAVDPPTVPVRSTAETPTATAPSQPATTQPTTAPSVLFWGQKYGLQPVDSNGGWQYISLIAGGPRCAKAFAVQTVQIIETYYDANGPIAKVEKDVTEWMPLDNVGALWGATDVANSTDDFSPIISALAKGVKGIQNGNPCTVTHVTFVENFSCVFCTAVDIQSDQANGPPARAATPLDYDPQNAEQMISSFSTNYDQSMPHPHWGNPDPKYSKNRPFPGSNTFLYGSIRPAAGTNLFTVGHKDTVAATVTQVAGAAVITDTSKSIDWSFPSAELPPFNANPDR